ncbi:bitesize isoform X5 [Musca autumnalis]|uniref:bitesize isoform X5 n=2 Tax=Musca autumnalis TaxID=221902 RepID=UPI003CF5D0C0
MIMSSGRSARLPPTPNAPNNKQWAPNSSTPAATSSLHETNSNNLNMYHHQHQYSNTTAVPGMTHMTGGMGDSGLSDVITTADAATEGIPGETIEALGPELAVATSKVLESLSENERKMIIEVLNRDESVRQRDATRIMEIQASSGDWLKGSCGAVDHLATSDVLRKSIRRSWTISNPEDDPNNPNAQNPVADNLYPQQQNLIEAQSSGSYPTLDVRHHQHHNLPQSIRSHPIVNYNTGSAITIAGVGVSHSNISAGYHVNPQRRVLRQSTLPTTLPNNEQNLTGSGSNLENYNSVNLTAPTSPHQMQKGPLYPSAYNSDDIINIETSDCDNYAQQLQQQQQPIASGQVTPTHHRLQVRRQSTLPANPCQPPMYMSTSPNRGYSRSPERSPGEQRYPPFIRQTSFPCNIMEPPAPASATAATSSYPSAMHRGKMLPSTGNFNQYDQTQPTQSTALAEDLEYNAPGMPKPRMMRQATLPNPDQHVKLLPTSPPKRQTSPQYRRSPEFMRQQTLPNPESFTSSNSLTVQSANSGSQNKFLPISPRQKQNFLFPNVQNPRQFLSQQNVPAVGVAEIPVSTTAEHYSSSQSVNIHHSRDHSKMIKVRSHSNEEYSITKSHHPESRRLLPEIPTASSRSMSRSPSRLVRQDCLKDQPAAGVSHVPGEGHTRTFGEAKQQFHQFQNVTEEDDNRPEYVDYFGDSTSSFLEADEVQYEKNYNSGFSSEPRIIYNDGSDDGSYQGYQRPIVHSAENVLLPDQGYGGYYKADPSTALGQHSFGVNLGANGVMAAAGGSGGGGALPRTPLMHNRLRRRQSRDLQAQQEEFAQVASLNVQASQSPSMSPPNEATSTATESEAVAAEAKSSERPKPEQMRSISEDSGANKSNVPKPVTRRSLSHPEKETQTTKKVEPTKIPSPKPLADILDKSRPMTKIPTPRRRNSKGVDIEEGGNLKSHLNERKHSESTTKPNRNQNDDKQQQQEVKDYNLDADENKQHPKDNEEQQQRSKSPRGETQTQNNDTKDPTSDDKTEGNAQLTKTHTTTLGEQEIQNAVEAAAVIFKKVVLQRRQEKKAAEEEEAKAAAEELSRSPVMGQRNYDPASSPLQSRGSGSSETWPQQSDEDIDRLVAMHQNRSSLSSLGLRSDSMASVYSGAGEGRYGTVVVKGQVEFAMQYNYKLGALEIHVVRCKDLAAVDAKRNRSDPYVKVYLLPDKSKAGKRKTKVKKHTLNPIFDEVLRFHMPISSLESRTLWLTVWHSDMFGRNDFLGEVSVNLQGRVFDNPQSQWYLLQERSEPFDEVATYRGDIVVGLKYVPPEGAKTSFMRSNTSSSSGGLRKFGSIKSVAISKSDRSAKGGQLHVLVKEAKHLTPIKPNGTCDAFCKSYLLPDRTRSSKQKTPIVKRSTNPSWTYTIVYEDVTLEDLSERALELTVWDHDRLASNEFLGGVRFSLGTGKSYGRIVDWMDASGKELSLWQNMLDRPNFWVEGSVVLRSSLDGIRAIP